MFVGGKLPYKPQVIKPINAPYVVFVAEIWLKDYRAFKFFDNPALLGYAELSAERRVECRYFCYLQVVSIMVV